VFLRRSKACRPAPENASAIDRAQFLDARQGYRDGASIALRVVEAALQLPTTRAAKKAARHPEAPQPCFAFAGLDTKEGLQVSHR
jgi:hypothetical protein